MTPRQSPSVSVVIPCFDQAGFLPAAIASVRSQSIQPLELIVVDDGSSDGTAAVARRLGAIVIGQPQTGVSEARNAGLGAAAGELVVMLDADDELLPDALERGIAAWSSRPGALMAAGRCQPIDPDGRPLPTEYHPIPADGRHLYAEWLSRNFVWTPGAAIFRRDALVQAGGFPPRLGPVADYAVYLRLARTGPVVLHHDCVVRYRQHDASMSRDSVMMLALTLDVLRRERREAGRRHMDDITRGKRAWRAWYGERMLSRLRADWHAGRRGAEQLRYLLALCRHAPGLLLNHAGRKLRILIDRIVQAASPRWFARGSRGQGDVAR